MRRSPQVNAQALLAALQFSGRTGKHQK